MHGPKPATIARLDGADGDEVDDDVGRDTAARGEPQEHVRDFCVGKLSLAKVVKWTPPMNTGAYQKTTATYTYKVAPAARIVDPCAPQVFPMIARIVNGHGRWS